MIFACTLYKCTASITQITQDPQRIVLILIKITIETWSGCLCIKDKLFLKNQDVLITMDLSNSGAK